MPWHLQWHAMASAIAGAMACKWNMAGNITAGYITAGYIKAGYIMAGYITAGHILAVPGSPTKSNYFLKRIQLCDTADMSAV